MEKTLEVMEIQRFAVHDGDGIRTTVFLQGCPLRCPWCANPESQSRHRQVMYTKEKCSGCLKCMNGCKAGAIAEQDHRPVFTRERCSGCRACEKECPSEAIRLSGKMMTVAEVLELVMKDEEYYRMTGGGITISGGEPFGQYDGLLELLKASKRKELHTAIETTGQTTLWQLAEAEPYIDLFLFDIKHIDADLFQQTTKGNLPVIWNNLEYLAGTAPDKIVLRIPVLPGFNMEEDVIGHIFDMAINLDIKRVSLLPYHTLGKNKYEKLGMKYYFPEDKMLKNEALLPFQEMGRNKKLVVTISE